MTRSAKQIDPSLPDARMANPLHSATYSLYRAKRHIQTLEAELQEFFESKPFTKHVELDSDKTHDIHRIKLAKPLPEDLSGTAFDAVSNLRASLDQAGYAIGVASGKNGKNSHFPFGDTLDEVKSRACQGSKDIPEPLFNVMAAAGPYKDGNALLWALNKLCNLHKHEIVTPVAIYTGGGSIRNLYFSAVKSFTFPPKWDENKAEMILAVVPRGAPMECDMTIATLVAFAKIDVLFQKPIVPVLNSIAGSIAEIIQSLEAEAVATGLFK